MGGTTERENKEIVILREGTIEGLEKNPMLEKHPRTYKVSTDRTASNRGEGA